MAGKIPQLHISPPAPLLYVLEQKAKQWGSSRSNMAKIALERQYQEELEAVYQAIDRGELIIVDNKVIEVPKNGNGKK